MAAAVGFARDHGLLLSVKGGGHNIAGTSIAERGLTIDLSRMRGSTSIPTPSWPTSDRAACSRMSTRRPRSTGWRRRVGFISEVGVAGLTLGGGLGYLTRRFGWTVDNLEEVEIVTADSRIRRASREENPDLFWAIRGAGANLGVVTRFTFRLHQVGPTVYGGLIAWPFERAKEILQAYRTITTQAPRELTVFLVLSAPAAPFVPEAWRQADLRHGRLLQRRPGPRRPGAGPRSGRSATRSWTCSQSSPTPRCSPTSMTASPRAPLLLEDRVPRPVGRRAAVGP